MHLEPGGALSRGQSRGPGAGEVPEIRLAVRSPDAKSKLVVPRRLALRIGRVRVDPAEPVRCVYRWIDRQTLACLRSLPASAGQTVHIVRFRSGAAILDQELDVFPERGVARTAALLGSEVEAMPGVRPEDLAQAGEIRPGLRHIPLRAGRRWLVSASREQEQPENAERRGGAHRAARVRPGGS